MNLQNDAGRIPRFKSINRRQLLWRPTDIEELVLR